MSRGLGTAITNELAKNGFKLATLISVNVGNSTFNITDYGVQLTDTDSTVYLDGASVINISDVSETGALKVNSFDLTLTGADQTFISAFLQNDYIDKQAIIRRAIVSGTNTVIDSFIYFDGRITTFSIDDTETESSMAIEIASHWADFEKLNNRKTNLNSQQIHFPNDIGFEYAANTTKDLRWGREG